MGFIKGTPDNNKYNLLYFWRQGVKKIIWPMKIMNYNWTVFDNLNFFAGVYGLYGADKKTKIDCQARALYIEDFDNEPNANLTFLSDLTNYV